MKKFISFALAASMALSMIPATAFASSDLSASHSNIRVTANTEFKPKKDAGDDYRDVPYILLEAKSDFLNEKQTFEVALENAEWLETDDDGDILYVEDQDTMEDYVQFVPENGASTTGGTTATPSTTQPIGTLERAYVNAATDLKKAADAYLSAVAVANPAAAKAALDAAKTNLDSAKADVSAAEKEVATISAAIADVSAIADTYKAAIEYMNGDEYTALTATTEDNPRVSAAASDTTSGAYLATTASNDTDGWTSVYYNVSNSGAAFDSATDMIAAIDAVIGKESEMTSEGKQQAAKYDTQKKNVDDSNKARADVAAAQEVFAVAGAVGNDKTGAIDMTNAEKKLADAQTAVDDAKAIQTQRQTAYDKALEAYNNAAGAGVATAKADLDKALDARNKAGQALVDGYGSQGVEIIRVADKNAGYAKFATATDSETITYDSVSGKNYGTDCGIKAFNVNGVVAGEYTTADLINKDGSKSKLTVEINKKSDTRIIVTTDGYKFRDGDVLRIPLFVRTTGGVASVSVDSLNSEFTSEGKTFARTADGDTNLTIEKTQSFYDGDEIKNIYIEELVPGTIEEDGVVSLRVNGDFLLKRGTNFKVERITGNNLTQDLTESVYTDAKCTKAFTKGDDSDEIYIEFGGSKSTQAAQYRITGLLIVEDGADFGDEATLTVSGGGTSKQTVTIGTYEDYGVKMTAEDKDLPVIYAGTKASSKYDNQTLKVTIEETVANSFIDNRKMELTLPDGVEFVNDNGDARTELGSIDDVTEDFKIYNFKGTINQVKDAFTVDKDGGKITITSKDLGEAFESSGNNKDRKRRIEFSLHVAAEADFTGDVVLTLNGPAVANQEVSATIATVKAPIEVRTTVNELKIDYRNTEIADITLVEPEAGLWAKDDVIKLEGERMSFEGNAKAEVVSGDMKLDKLGGDYVDTEDSGDDRNGVLFVKVDSRSSKTPAEIKLSNLSLYMNRSLAAGDYKLKVMGDEDNEFFMNNYDDNGDDYANSFETRKVTVMNDFVKVVTAGREVDDATFTTTIVVPIGSDTITAGTREIKLSEMQGGACPAAYINNDGYTMLPVRAVTEALNSVASVRWDDATKTCTIGFGQRVFSMTVGSKVLNMNGVSTPLNAAPEIRDGRVFLPLRDLGYALGLSENKISWDATTQTAKLN